jgi:NADPH:quinone reductase-like Zn-dependent oxidoreductase
MQMTQSFHLVTKCSDLSQQVSTCIQLVSSLLSSSSRIPDVSVATRQGALAQYARISSDFLVTRPPNVSPVEASGITLAAQTAYQALVDIGQLQSGQTVLVNGGSSAVGAFAIQIAKAKGAIVVATASTKNEGFVRLQGADQASPIFSLFNLRLPFVYGSSSTIPRALYMNTLPSILFPRSFI